MIGHVAALIRKKSLVGGSSGSLLTFSLPGFRMKVHTVLRSDM